MSKNNSLEVAGTKIRNPVLKTLVYIYIAPLVLATVISAILLVVSAII